MHSTDSGSQNVPGFLVKLWKIVDDAECNDLIAWNANGTSFIIHNQARFAKEIVPLYFKHNNMASFIRQLNMYGFRKVTNIEGGMNTDNDEVEFYHIFFIRNQESLLQYIKRKVPSTKTGDAKQAVVKEMISDVKVIRGKQENIESLLVKMKQENEILWREVAVLRQKHMKQQQLVEKILQFLVTVVQPGKNLALKRKNPLMILDSGGGKNLHLSVDDESSLNMPMVSGPVIHDVTDFVDDTSIDKSNLSQTPVHLGNTSSAKSSEVETVSNLIDSTLGSPLNTNEPIESLGILDALQTSVLDMAEDLPLQEKEITGTQEESSLLITSPLNTPLIEVSPLSPLHLAPDVENIESNVKSKEPCIKENVKKDIAPSFANICHLTSELSNLSDPVMSTLSVTPKGKGLCVGERTSMSPKNSASLSSLSCVESSAAALSDTAACSSLNTSVAAPSSTTSSLEAPATTTSCNKGGLDDMKRSIGENIQPSFADLLEAICEPAPSPKPLTRTAFNDHLERTEDELDWLQEQLLHGGLNVDSEALLEFFSKDDSSYQQRVSSSSNSGFINDSEEPTGDIIGNELTKFPHLLMDLVLDYKQMAATEGFSSVDEKSGMVVTPTDLNHKVEVSDEPKDKLSRRTKTDSPVSENDSIQKKACHIRKSPRSKRKSQFVKNRSS